MLHNSVLNNNALEDSIWQFSAMIVIKDLSSYIDKKVKQLTHSVSRLSHNLSLKDLQQQLPPLATLTTEDRRFYKIQLAISLQNELKKLAQEYITKIRQRNVENNKDLLANYLSDVAKLLIDTTELMNKIDPIQTSRNPYSTSAQENRKSDMYSYLKTMTTRCHDLQASLSKNSDVTQVKVIIDNSTLGGKVENKLRSLQAGINKNPKDEVLIGKLNVLKEAKLYLQAGERLGLLIGEVKDEDHKKMLINEFLLAKHALEKAIKENYIYYSATRLLTSEVETLVNQVKATNENRMGMCHLFLRSTPAEGEYKTSDKQHVHLYEESYELNVMSKYHQLQRVGDIQCEATDEGLHYRVRQKNNNLVKAIIPWSDLEEIGKANGLPIKKNATFFVENQSKWLPHILQLTAKNHHTHNENNAFFFKTGTGAFTYFKIDNFKIRYSKFNNEECIDPEIYLPILDKTRELGLTQGIYKLYSFTPSAAASSAPLLEQKEEKQDENASFVFFTKKIEDDRQRVRSYVSQLRDQQYRLMGRAVSSQDKAKLLLIDLALDLCGHYTGKDVPTLSKVKLDYLIKMHKQYEHAYGVKIGKKEMSTTLQNIQPIIDYAIKSYDAQSYKAVSIHTAQPPTAASQFGASSPRGIRMFEQAEVKQDSVNELADLNKLLELYGCEITENPNDYRLNYSLENKERKPSSLIDFLKQERILDVDQQPNGEERYYSIQKDKLSSGILQLLIKDIDNAKPGVDRNSPVV